MAYPNDYEYSDWSVYDDVEKGSYVIRNTQNVDGLNVKLLDTKGGSLREGKIKFEFRFINSQAAGYRAWVEIHFYGDITAPVSYKWIVGKVYGQIGTTTTEWLRVRYVDSGGNLIYYIDYDDTNLDFVDWDWITVEWWDGGDGYYYSKITIGDGTKVQIPTQQVTGSDYSNYQWWLSSYYDAYASAIDTRIDNLYVYERVRILGGE